MLCVDAVITSGVILQFVEDFNTAGYAVFAYIIIEAAIRFELVGSLSALVFFFLGCCIVHMHFILIVYLYSVEKKMQYFAL